MLPLDQLHQQSPLSFNQLLDYYVSFIDLPLHCSDQLQDNLSSPILEMGSLRKRPIHFFPELRPRREHKIVASRQILASALVLTDAGFKETDILNLIVQPQSNFHHSWHLLIHFPFSSSESC
jgi:hypothetical protein